MNYLNSFNEYVKSMLLLHSKSNDLNIKVIEERKQSILDLKKIEIELRTSAKELIKTIETLNNIQSDEITKMNQLLNNLAPANAEKSPAEVSKEDNIHVASSTVHEVNSAADWKTVTKGKSYSNVTAKQVTILKRPSICNNDDSGSIQDQKSILDPQSLISASLPFTKINITNAIGLNAIKINHRNGIQTEGVLYYIESMNHFAIKLGGHVFHGNIGNIFIDEKTPTKIKNCKFENNCIKGSNCDYYHDPFKFNKSTDFRNYVANSWLYTSSRINGKGRRFGSRDNLDTDMLSITNDEINKFCDQLMHDLLCVLCLKSYFKGN